MSRRDRIAWRVAARARHALFEQHRVEQRRQVDQLHPAAAVMQRLPRLARRLDKAQARGWAGAFRRIHEQLRRAREEAEAELAALGRVLRQPARPVPSLRELAAELNQLEDEFGDWRYERSEAALCAVTEPIELEHVALGRFEIRLHLDELADLAQRRPYDVVALDPNPAAGSSQVTHPHVADERLCEGEAASAIRAALAEGRFAEFFLLVRSVLTTYNPNSPYVSLEEWSGEPCTECGDRVHSDDRGTCERCEQTVCDTCGEPCADCRQYHCPACLTSCAHCEERICVHCLERCAGCEQRCCAGCLDDELCPECRQQQEEDQDHEQDEPEEGIQEQGREQPVAPVPQGTPRL